MLKKLFVGTAIAAMMTGSALAQDAGGNAPVDFEPQDRAVFVNEDGSMKTDDDIRSGFMALPVERQDAIRASCIEIRDAAKGGTQQQRTDNNDGQDNPVPGVYDQYVACDMVDTM